MTRISFPSQTFTPLNRQTLVNFTSNNGKNSETDKPVESESNYSNHDQKTKDNPWCTSTLLLDKGKESKNPIVADAISRLYKIVVKEQKDIPKELIHEKYRRNPLDSISNADNPKARVLTQKVKLDDDTYVLLGIDRGIIREDSCGQKGNVPEAFIKVVDKAGKPKTKMYYTASYGSVGLFSAKPLYCHFDKLLLKIADKVCKESQQQDLRTVYPELLD